MGSMKAISNPKGEFTVVVELGQMIDYKTVAIPEDSALAAQFGELTVNKVNTRRQAIAILATRHRMPANQIYDALERVKSMGE